MTQVIKAPVRTGYEVVQRILESEKRGGERKPGDHPSLTSKEVADRLNRGDKRWHDQNRDGKIELTYEFCAVEPSVLEDIQSKYGDLTVKEIVPLNLRQKELIRKAQQDFADVANVSFVEQAGGNREGHLIYRAYNTGDQASSVTGFADTADGPGMLWLRNLDQTTKFGNWADDDKRMIGEDHWRSSMIHELGHGLGLEHPHSETNETIKLPFYEEDWKHYTVMSYNRQRLNDKGDSLEPASLMMDDIEAIQSKYGANYATRNDDTTYGFNSNTDRDHYSLKTAQDQPIFTVWDGGGWDVLDFSEFSQNQTINLNAGSLSSVGGFYDNVGIANGVTIEEARGGKGRNTLIGNNTFNVLRGGPAKDRIYGGSGGAQMWGGNGANTFVFDTTSSGRPNWVMDFVSGKDKLDLTGIRQQLGPLNFVASLPVDHNKPQDPLNPTFKTQPGDVVVSYNEDFQRTIFKMDTTGDSKLDMQIEVHGKVAREDLVV